MESLKEKAKEVGKEVEENGSSWSQILKELVDKLTGKDMGVTYEFDNLEIEIPKATGPGGKEIGSAKWTVDGKIVISTEILDKAKTIE